MSKKNVANNVRQQREISDKFLPGGALPLASALRMTFGDYVILILLLRVAVMMFNTTRNAFVLVRQFRPGEYFIFFRIVEEMLNDVSCLFRLPL